jgi:plastocyanin
MSIMGRHIPLRIVAIAVLLLIVVAGGVILPATGVWPPARSPERQITLVARNMAFYLENDPSTPNPTIQVKPGERVRIVLQNRDRGMVHDFAVPALRAALDLVPWNEDGDVMFEAPARPGTYEYTCRPHAAMMRGTIVIGER